MGVHSRSLRSGPVPQARLGVKVDLKKFPYNSQNRGNIRKEMCNHCCCLELKLKHPQHVL